MEDYTRKSKFLNIIEQKIRFQCNHLIKYAENDTTFQCISCIKVATQKEGFTCEGNCINICYDCTNKFIKAKASQSYADIQCDKKHPLLKIYNIYINNFFNCNGCGLTKNASINGVYHCYLCQYDICEDCYSEGCINKIGSQDSEKYIQIIRQNIRFQCNHMLKYVEQNKTFSCISCTKFISQKEGFTCESHCMSICYYCIQVFIKAKASQKNEDQKCYKGHYLLKVNEIYANNTFICNLCQKLKNAAIKGDYHCYPCQYDVCYECYNGGGNDYGVEYEDNGNELAYYENPSIIGDMVNMSTNFMNIVNRNIRCQCNHMLRYVASDRTFDCISCNVKTSYKEGFTCEGNCMSICYDCAHIFIKAQESKHNENTITCNNGHSLLKINKIYMDNTFSCDGCKKLDYANINGVYHCYPCIYDLCQNCYNSRCKANVKTSNNEKYINVVNQMIRFQCTHMVKYIEKDESFACISCTKLTSYKEGFTCEGNCMIICYDCINVLINAQELQTNESITCDKKHLLLKVNKIYVDNTFNCNGCKKVDNADINGLYHCYPCQYDLCQNCYNSRCKTKAKTSNNEKYIKVVNQMIRFQCTHMVKYIEKDGSSACVSCTKLTPYKEGFTCEGNCMNICYGCINVLINAQELQTNQCITCDRKHSLLKVNKIYVDNTFNCNGCKKVDNADINGLYHCYPCQYDLCQNCYTSKTMSRNVPNNEKYVKITDQNIKSQCNHMLKYMENDRTFQCASCTKATIQKEGFTCEGGCMNICYDCTNIFIKAQEAHINEGIKCKDDHSLLKINKIYTDNIFCCNECGKLGNASTNGVYHCYPCMYDLCPACYNHEKEAYNQMNILYKSFITTPAATTTTLKEETTKPDTTTINTAAANSAPKEEVPSNPYLALRDKYDKIVNQNIRCQCGRYMTHDFYDSYFTCYSCTKKTLCKEGFACDNSFCLKFCYDCMMIYIKAQKSYIKEDITCDKGHSLYKINKIYVDDTFICNLCKKRGNAAINGDYHCYPCNYDLCIDCYKMEKKLINHIESVYSIKGDKYAQIIQRNIMLQCNHKVKYVENEETYKCVSCIKRTRNKEGFTCERGCINICYNCIMIYINAQESSIKEDITCDKGHSLIRVNKVYTNNNFSCNQCRKSDNAAINVDYHCYPCQYDLCKACYDKNPNRKEQPKDHENNQKLSFEDAACDNGHFINKIFSVDSVLGYKCTKCEKKKNPSIGGVYNCKACEFYQCSDCFNMKPKFQDQVKGYYKINGMKHSIKGIFKINQDLSVIGWTIDDLGKAYWLGAYYHNEFRFIKSYHGKYNIVYHGELIGTKMKGKWKKDNVFDEFELNFGSFNFHEQVHLEDVAKK